MKKCKHCQEIKGNTAAVDWRDCCVFCGRLLAGAKVKTYINILEFLAVERGYTKVSELPEGPLGITREDVQRYSEQLWGKTEQDW